MYLLLDIGGTKTRLAISSDGKSLGPSKIIPTNPDFDRAIEEIKKNADQLSGYQKMEKVALGIAGPLDKEKTMVIAAPNLHWNNKPLKRQLENLFGCLVIVENDAVASTLGEANFGAGQGKKIVSYIGIGTGVGGARVIDGKLDQNSLGFEPGHQIIMPDGNLCGCGGKGHLESYISGTALKNLKGIPAEEIKDPVVWDQVAKYLSLGLNNVAVFWSPDIIILGGSLMQSINLEKVKQYFKEVLTIFPNSPEIDTSKLGDSSGLYGALSLVGAAGQ